MVGQPATRMYQNPLTGRVRTNPASVFLCELRRSTGRPVHALVVATCPLRTRRAVDPPRTRDSARYRGELRDDGTESVRMDR